MLAARASNAPGAEPRPAPRCGATSCAQAVGCADPGGDGSTKVTIGTPMRTRSSAPGARASGRASRPRRATALASRGRRRQDVPRRVLRRAEALRRAPPSRDARARANRRRRHGRGAAAADARRAVSLAAAADAARTRTSSRRSAEGAARCRRDRKKRKKRRARAERERATAPTWTTSAESAWHVAEVSAANPARWSSRTTRWCCMSGTCRGSGSRGTSPAGSRASPWMRRLVTTRRRRSGTRDVSSRHHTARERRSLKGERRRRRGEKKRSRWVRLCPLWVRVGVTLTRCGATRSDARLFLDGYARVSHAAPSRYSRELFGDGDDSRRNRGGGYHQTRRPFERDDDDRLRELESLRRAYRAIARGRRRRRRGRSPVEPTRVSPELGRVHGRPAAASIVPAGGGERREAGGERREVRDVDAAAGRVVVVDGDRVRVRVRGELHVRRRAGRGAARKW